MTPIKQAKHYFSQFHPTYVGADKAAALAKEAGFENWVQHFSDLNNAWSELPKFNTDRPMLTAYRLAEVGTDLARWERNPTTGRSTSRVTSFPIWTASTSN